MDNQMIVIENEKGVKRNYEMYFTFEVDGVEYIALHDIKDNEVLLLKYFPGENGQFYMEMIEEEIFEKVSEEFINILEDR
jgi:hypothetical protein